MIADTTPVIIGVGQFVERLDAADYTGLSPAELCVKAIRAACLDAGQEEFAGQIDAIGCTRSFEDSTSAPAPLGKPNKFPLAVAKRLGIKPHLAILEKAGGQSPLSLLADLGNRIAAGDITLAVMTGAEAISTVRHFKNAAEKPDWSEHYDQPIEDHGRGMAKMMTMYNVAHRLTGAPAPYGLLENARRARLKLSRAAYAQQMGELFAPFTKVATANPYSAAATAAMTAEEIVTVGERNRMIADPYPVKLIARDQVNQAAAVLLTSAGNARALGIAESQWIFLHGLALTEERDLIRRADMGASPAAAAALSAALQRADCTLEDIAAFDFYSCFPIAVFVSAIDALGLSADDPRGLTVTGGLPYFGGPGNNYSMHAIAGMAELLRQSPGKFGMVAANGGFISKYGAAVFSTAAAAWQNWDNAAIQARLDAVPDAVVQHRAYGRGRVLTYTIVYAKGAPDHGIVVGELESGGRFLAVSADPSIVARMVADDPIGQTIFVRPVETANRFAFEQAVLDAKYPVLRPSFIKAYEHVLFEKRDAVLEITINRPEARNALTPAAHQELSDLFDLFEADDDLRVAILTGSGKLAFCSGNDLKYSASGKPMWIPASGFGGITTRAGRTKPVIAAVNGFAFGGGFEICLACDLVVADPGASFALPEVKVGLIAAAGGIVRLPRQIPKKLAVELLLTGKPINAAKAAELGIVNRIAEPGQVLEKARALAAEIVAVSPTSVRLTMQLAEEAEAVPSELAAAAHRSSVIDELIFSEDMMEGLTAFAQKRAPVWKNR